MATSPLPYNASNCCCARPVFRHIHCRTTYSCYKASTLGSRVCASTVQSHLNSSSASNFYLGIISAVLCDHFWSPRNLISKLLRWPAQVRAHGKPGKPNQEACQKVQGRGGAAQQQERTWAGRLYSAFTMRPIIFCIGYSCLLRRNGKAPAVTTLRGCAGFAVGQGRAPTRASGRSADGKQQCRQSPTRRAEPFRLPCAGLASLPLRAITDGTSGCRTSVATVPTDVS